LNFPAEIPLNGNAAANNHSVATKYGTHVVLLYIILITQITLDRTNTSTIGPTEPIGEG
jgi:hypothetical protein